MSLKKIKSKDMVAKTKNKVLSCSTPEHRLDSPSRDSDSIYDSDAASPVPFLCTQDGAEGETDVVWNYYTPKSGATKSNFKNTTPSRKSNKTGRCRIIEKLPPKRKMLNPLQKQKKIFQELSEFNHNLHELINKAAAVSEKPQSEEDIFSDTSDISPRSGLKNKKRCLRKNILSSKFIKTEPESGLESDDSMNELLLKASQIEEEKLGLAVAKRPCLELSNKKSLTKNQNVNFDHDSMDAILSNIKIESPIGSKPKQFGTPKLHNDSFDSLLGNLNDSVLEKLSQMPIMNESSIKVPSCKKEVKWACDGSPSSNTLFGRHSSMPESPSISESNKPSTSGMVFGRYNSMPFNNSIDKATVPSNSPIRCTPDEIKRKHQLAREKLLAKRTLPFMTTQSNSTQPSQNGNKFGPKKPVFQPRVPTAINSIETKSKTEIKQSNTDSQKLLIEKKKQEALNRLRRKHQNKC